MNKVFKKVLLIYKKSAYSIYFMERRIQLAERGQANLRGEMKRFKKAHDEHYGALKETERILRKYGVKYTKRFRGGNVNYARYDLIITVGGDGTFLEASRNIKDQAIIGVNSAPSFSVGKLCIASVKNFEKIIRRVVAQKFILSPWQRLRLDLERHIRPVDCVNDILICHINPAAMSRYYLEIGRIKEEQRNSGLWVATPAGSSGAIGSAGGRRVQVNEKRMQYMPRELYYGFSPKYRHKGGVLPRGQTLAVTSLMRNGMIFVDGTHFKLKFPFNTKLKVSFSPHPLRAVRIQ